ncbi:hypothetical protein [Serinicoccus sp. LYQ131]|uniref:hypothetical protein n=1 Tax=Serinicoccus sp. LYQ131 TaxID=3378797 RepID=UPI003852AD2A
MVAARDGTGRPALRLPAYSSSPSPGRAIVRVTPVGGSADPLAPGTRDFVVGADFALDTESQGTEVDGGNNLIQRGLASDESQFKIDIDDRRPLCRVQGSQGVAEVRMTGEVQPERWHRATCSRTGDEVRLTVEVLDDGVGTALETVTVEVVTGDLRWDRAQTPVSVGGKLAANGEIIRSATDQFNGAVANPVLQITD